MEHIELMEAWDVVDRIYDMNALDSNCAFKLKQFPDGRIKKFKARFCDICHQQLKGIDFY